MERMIPPGESLTSSGWFLLSEPDQVVRYASRIMGYLALGTTVAVGAAILIFG